MSNKIKELKEEIENNSISYSDLMDFDDELTLIQLYASESVTFEIKEKENYFVVIKNYHSEETEMTIEDEQTFNTVKEVLEFID